MQLVLSHKSAEDTPRPALRLRRGMLADIVLAKIASEIADELPPACAPKKEFSKALIPGNPIIGTMRGRLLVCIVLGLVAVTPLLAPAVTPGQAGSAPRGTPAGWSEDINLSNDPAHQDTVPEMAVSGSNVHAVWLNDYKNVYYSKSDNEGANWITPISLYNATSNNQYPDIAVNNDSVHVVWSRAYRIFYRNSTDNGETWNQMKFISNDTGLAQRASMFLNGDNIHVIWYDQRDGSNGEAYYRRSLDGGITFDNGQGVDEDRRISFSPSVIGKPKIAGYQTNISVTWYDERNGDFEIYWMISKDNGATWEDGLGNVGQDRRLTFTGVTDYALGVYGSNIYIVWDKYVWPGPTYTLYYCNSSNNGLTWSSAQVLSGLSPAMAWPDINAYNTNVSIVWQDARDDGTHDQIYIKNSTDGGISWNSDIRLTNNLTRPSTNPKIYLINGTTHLIWLGTFSGDNDVYYKRYPDFPPDPEYNITLSQGWNLISLPLAQRDENISKALESIAGKWNCIQFYNASDQQNHWKSNMTFRPDQLNDLNTLNHKMGFWINITEPNVTLTVNGPIPTNTSIPLKAGWNMVGYPTLNTTTTVANALWGTGADNVEVCDPTDPYRTKEVGPTYVMKPGEGYWVHVPADTIWVVDW
jgi:hypothetical protein